MPHDRFVRSSASGRRFQFWMVVGIVVASAALFALRLIWMPPPVSYEEELARACRPLYQAAKTARDTTSVDWFHPARDARSGSGAVDPLSCGVVRAHGLIK